MRTKKDVLADLGRMYLGEVRKTHTKGQRRALYQKMRELARKEQLESWIHFSSGLLASVGDIPWEVGLAEHDQALALDPTLAYAWNGKGNILLEKKRYTEALVTFERAIALDHGFAYPWNGKSIALLGSGRHDEALATIREATALDPSYASAWNTLGIILFERKEYAGALEALDKAIGIDPDFPGAWNEKGQVLAAVGRLDEALGAFKKAISLDPTEPLFVFNEGLLLWKTQRNEDAHAAFTRSLALHPDSDLESIARLWERRTVGGRKSAKRPQSDAPGEDYVEASGRRPVVPAGLGADLYQTLKDLHLLEKVGAARDSMKAALSRALDAPRAALGADDEGLLLVLRDWNSFTPLLPSLFRPQMPISPALRLGGGYYLVWRGHGIAIDPGIDFVAQLYRKQLSISDIDSIIVTHCHLDHTRDVEALVDLNYRYNLRRGCAPKTREFREIKCFLSPAAYTKYAEHLKNTGCCSKPELMYGDQGSRQLTSNIIMTPKEVFHRDISSDTETVGLVFDLMGTDGKALRVGVTSDSRSDYSLGKKFAGCEVLVGHLGTLETVEEFLHEGLNNHLGLRGCYSLVQEVQPRLFVMGEFGEELMESRLEIVRVMARHKPDRTVCVLGADSNLAIGLGADLSVHCSHPGCGPSPTRIPLRDVVPIIGDDGLFRYYCARHSTLAPY